MNTRTRLAAGFTAAILMAGGLALAAAAPASAHTPEVSSTCETLSVKLTAYEGSGNSTPNNVTVTIDGEEVDNVDFGQSFQKTYDFDDKYEAHSYIVKIDAKGYDRTFENSSVPCEAPPLTKDATAELTVTPPTCEVPAKLVLGTTKHATWGTPSATDGPAAYAVTATAKKGHLFASGDATQVFTGDLAGVLDPNEAPCYVPPVIPNEPDPIVTSVDKETVDCTSKTVTTVTTTTTTDWVYDEETNTWVKAEPVITTASVTRDATATECPIVVPPVTPVTPAAASEKLASTGFDSGWLLPLAALLLVAGVALPALRRLRHQ
ncbi:hypothetical protein [Glaciibacter superstes]|uniref:hypothetical protein n=1 Tax=Glaciibacter superstes TaxID=501023 RepID=UPI0003FD58AF|nr:hypothetical protein [Glaciibacter superstes]